MIRRFASVTVVLALFAICSAPVFAAPSATQVVKNFYASYLAATKRGTDGHFDPAPYLTPRLAKLLADAHAKERTCRCAIVDWDVFDGAQVRIWAYAVQTTKARTSGANATVPIDLTYEWAGKPGGHATMTIHSVRNGGRWLISDFVDPHGRSALHDIAGALSQAK